MTEGHHQGWHRAHRHGPGSQEFSAVIVTVLNELEVECMPQDLPARVVIDISGLTEVGAGIHVRDVVISDKVKILDDPAEMIVVASATRAEKVVEEAPAEEEAEPEASEPGKKTNRSPRRRSFRHPNRGASRARWVFLPNLTGRKNLWWRAKACAGALALRAQPTKGQNARRMALVRYIPQLCLFPDIR
jgi:hypothetical protein